MKKNININYEMIISIVSLFLLMLGIIIPFKSNANSMNEVNKIDFEINEIIKSAKRTEKKAIVLDAEESKQIHDLQMSKFNILNNTEDNEKNIYEGKFMIITGNSTMNIKKELSKKEQEIIYEEIINVLDNIELNDRYIEDLTFIVSPYELKGINGFTLAKTKGKELDQYIVISYSPNFLEVGGDIHRELIRSTILHEIGHTYKNRLEKYETKSFEKNYKKFYAEINKNDNLEDKIEEWKNSENENFAEDFKVYFSGKIKDYSFEAKEKKTKMPYNENLHELIQIY